MYEDPDPPRLRIARDTGSDTSWVLGALAVLLVAGAVFVVLNRDNGQQTASTDLSRPAASTPTNPSPPTTTGSGSGSTNTDR